MILEGCGVITNERGKELIDHGTALFPIACYQEDVSALPVPWHWHDDWEIVLPIRGGVAVAAGAERLTVAEGEALFLNAGTLHEIAGEGPGCEIISAVFHPRLVAGMDSIVWQKYVQPVLQGCPALLLKPDVSWQAQCVRAFRAAWQAVADEPPGYELLVREELSRMIFLLGENQPAPRRSLSVAEARNTERIKIMLQFIQEHYGEPLTIGQIAESALISESECLRCFHQTIDATPIQYLRQFRLQMAADLLASTRDRAGDIGAACGFPDPAYFTKIFREVKGCTPMEYRRRKALERAAG